jgi:hypothetical protein
LPQSSNSRPIGLSHTTLPSARGAAAPSQTGGGAFTTTFVLSVGKTISAQEVAATVGDLSVARLPQLRSHGCRSFEICIVLGASLPCRAG